MMCRLRRAERVCRTSGHRARSQGNAGREPSTGKYKRHEIEHDWLAQDSRTIGSSASERLFQALPVDLHLPPYPTHHVLADRAVKQRRKRADRRAIHDLAVLAADDGNVAKLSVVDTSHNK